VYEVGLATRSVNNEHCHNKPGLTLHTVDDASHSPSRIAPCKAQISLNESHIMEARELCDLDGRVEVSHIETNANIFAHKCTRGLNLHQQRYHGSLLLRDNAVLGERRTEIIYRPTDIVQKEWTRGPVPEPRSLLLSSSCRRRLKLQPLTEMLC
jgi:hypothetical protein